METIILKGLLMLRIFCLILLTNALYAQDVADSLLLIDSFSIKYASNQYVITPEMENFIDHFLDSQNEQGLEFHITSYTDSDGSSAYNDALSMRRCKGIAEYLITLGVDSLKIKREALGERTLVDTEINETQKAYNRRTDVKIFQRDRFINFSGKVNGNDSTELLNAKVVVLDNGLKRTYDIQDDRSFSVPVPIGRLIKMHIKSDGYFTNVMKLRLNENSNVTHVEIKTEPMVLGAKVDAMINFVGDKSRVLGSSIDEMEALYFDLERAPNVCVELMGHINLPKQKLEDRNNRHFELSIARATEIRHFLLDRGISEDRLLSRGYGNSQMIYPDPKTPLEQIKNRRVEVEVIECDIARNEENDMIDNLESFRMASPIERDFIKENLERDLKELNPKVIKNILAQVKYLEGNDEDPSAFTYKELLQAYAMRMKSKNP